MALYQIKAPDGKTYRIEGPDGASQDDVIRAVVAQHPYAGFTTEELKDQPRAPMSLKDTARAGLASLVGSAGSIASAFGAESAPARGLREYAAEIQAGMSPERLEEMRRREEIMKRAGEQGVGSEIMAGLGAVAEAPLQSTVSGIASSVPAIGAGLAAMVASAPLAIASAVAFTARLAFGALQGAGEAKGNIFDSVTQKLMDEKGLSRADAEAQATKAQEYLSSNAPGIMGSAAAGMLDAVTGVESVLGKTAKAKPATRPLTQPSRLKTVGGATLEEAIPEGIQGGVGQITENVALQNAGINTDTFSGVAGAAARDALMGALTGAAVSPLQLSQARREYEVEKQRERDEAAAKLDQEIAQEQETLRQEQEAKQQAEEQAVMSAPPVEIKAPTNVHPIRNPLGDISKEDLQAEGIDPYLNQHIDEYRKTVGLPPIKSYSIEDIADAMPGVNPAEEQKQIDTILNSRTGYQGERLTARDVIDQAQAKQIPTDQAFTDFLTRTTGTGDLNSMSQPQLFAAFKSIQALPEKAELETGTNAIRFTDQQYNAAIKSLDKTMGDKPILTAEALSDIRLSTGLKEDAYAKSILDEAVRRGDVDRQGDQISPPTSAAVLPKGYKIQEGMFERGEKPEGYQIQMGDITLPEVYATEEEANARSQEYVKGQGRLVKEINNRIEQNETTLQKAEEKLTNMQLAGQTGIEYDKAQATLGKIRVKVAENLDRLNKQLERVDPEKAPVSVIKAKAKRVKGKGYTLFKDNKAVQVFKSRDEAERAIVQGLPEEEIQALTQAKGRRTLKRRAEEEIQRKAEEKRKEEYASVSQVLENKVKPPLRALLDRFGLKDVALELEKDMKAEGEYSKSVIKIALDSANPIRTLRHESIHALKELGFFTPQQWKALEREAKTKWIDTYLRQRNINGDPLEAGQQSRYDAYMSVYKGDQNAIIEEAIADAFGDFDMTKAPPGMMSAILKRLKLFFEALKNAFAGAGFQTSEDIFGKVERGALKPTKQVVKPSEPKFDQNDAWRATPQEREEALDMYATDGFLPYTSQGRLNVPIDEVKYSLQKYNPEKHLSFDPALNLPINKDGTITLYYHTTKDESLAINSTKVIPAQGRNRIHLTNESSGAKILVEKGDMEQDVDGSTVLVYVTPDMLQVDRMYDDGRVDVYIPVAQGEYFNKKMKQHSIQKARSDAIAKSFSYDDHEKRITDAIKQYKAATVAERKTLVTNARKLLKREHNVGSLLTENGKLEKTRIGDYNLNYDGLPVASQGLGLASAQKITEKTSTCPRSAICEGLCLGETSGGNFMFGGAAAEDVGSINKSSFRAGARMVQYLKTEALIVNPEAFAVILQSEIDSLRKWSASPTVRKKNAETGKMENIAKDIYAPAVRLNVTSDFKPSMFRGVIDGNKDVMFYDYTKINSDSIAPNHHLTYSSTGFGQIVDGKPVFFKNKAGRYDHNWETVKDRLNNGFNVAMAFSSKSALPKFLKDEKSGKTYRILDGDLYDARYLDQYSKEKEESEGAGVIVGLRNKAGTLSEKNATEKTDGFFVKYNPEDGDTVVVPDQDQFKTAEPPQPEPIKTIPIAKKKFSLRDTKEFKQWFGDSKVVDENGNPLVVYHGTGKDFSEFKYDPKKALGIWTSSDPKVASEYADISGRYVGHPSVMPLYLSLKNPATRKDYLETRNIAQAQSEKTGWGDHDARHRKLLQDRGFDGVNLGEGVYIAFEPNQLKSAIGNVGAYDITNPDIRYSLRDTPQFKQWFGDSKIVNEDGTPKVMYHGTARDITEFRPGQANAIFLTDDPKFAESFSSMSEDRMTFDLAQQLDEDPKAKRDLLIPIIDQAIKNKDLGTDKNSRGLIKTTREEHIKNYMGLPLDRAMNTVGIGDALRAKIKEQLPSRGNIIPVYVSAQNPFDFENPAHIKLISNELNFKPDVLDNVIYDIKNGEWSTIESGAVQDAIQFVGFDSFYVKEGGVKNLAVYNPEQLKSATGNVGTFDKYNPDIRYNLRNTTDPAIMADVDRVTTARVEQGFVERITNALSPESFSYFREKALNRYNRLGEYDRALVQKMGGAKLMADSSAEAAALMSDLGAGLTASALGVHDRVGGVPVYKNGVTTVSNLNNTVKGPVAIFAPLAKYGDPTIYQLYQYWAGAKRGKRLLADGREEVYTPAMIARAQKLGQQYPEFDQIQKEWIKFNNGLVKFLVDTGVLSKNKADEFTRYSDYVPFYRQFDGEKTIGPNLFASISGVKGPKKLKGGEAPLADFLETVVRNTQSSIQMGIKNVAAQRAANVATQIGQATRLNHVSSGPDVFTTLENGKLTYYQSHDPLFINAIKSLNLPDLPFLGLLSTPANVLRNLVTKDPGFMLANMVRDSMSAYVTSGANMKPVVSTIANFGKAISNSSPEYAALLNAGLIGGYEFSQNVEQSGKTMEEAMRIKAGIKKGTDYFTGVWQALEKGTTASDAATRMEVYKNTLAETGNEAEALFRAMEVMNFNRKGSSAVIRVLTAAVPFLNARIQGLDVLYRAAFGRMGNDPKAVQKAFIVRGMTMFALSCMYWALTHDDDEYKKQEQETRDNYWLFPSLGVKIPIPFEVGILFKVIPERIMGVTFGDDTGKDFARSMGRQLSSTLAFNPIPQTALPLVEVVTNHSFFTGRDIVPQGLKDVAPEFQVGPGTSMFAQWIGKMAGLSPIQIDHLFKGYTGTMGGYAVDVLDMVMDFNGDSPKVSKRLEQMPIIKRFALDPEARGTVTAFYEMKDSVDEITRTINLLEKSMNYKDMGEYMTDNMKLLATKDYIQDLEKQMKELRDMKNMIRNSQMSGDQKRDAILDITKMENQLTQNMQNLKKMVSE